MLTDTHCHLTDTPLIFRLPEILADAKNHDVTQFVVPSARFSDWQAVLDLRDKLPEIRAVAIGLHPWYAADWSENLSGNLNTILQQNPDIFIGEIGLDFFNHQSSSETQIFVFRQQIQLAKQFSRPVIIHNVKASLPIIQIIREEKFTFGGIIHAFSGSLEEARIFTKLGFKIGLGSLLLNPNTKKVRKLAKLLDLKNILLETDSPYMLPNQSNSPKNIRQIAEIVAEIREISLAELAQHCEENFTQLLVRD